MKTVFRMWEHQGWGNRITWSDWDTRRIDGHISNRRQIKPGTEVWAKMQSGRVGRFEVIDVEYCGGVEDMFFATVKDVGYLDPETALKATKEKPARFAISE